MFIQNNCYKRVDECDEPKESAAEQGRIHADVAEVQHLEQHDMD